MGQLSDTAKRNSNFLQIVKGESATVKYLGFKIVPSQQDPTKEVAQFKLEENGHTVFWTNGSGKILKFFDTIKPNDWVKISRNKWINKDGSEDTGKSTYEAELTAEPQEKEKAWDE
jgi:hypothetical protein